MRHEHRPDPTEGGLSTEDLAEPRGRRLDESAEPQPEVPTFPGESTAAANEPAEQRADERATPAEDEAPQLLTTEDEEGFRARWREIQNEFVDDPRDAVHTADALVADVMQTLATTFAEHKQELEGQWNRGEQVSTEDLRTALRHYRSFFNRLLTA
ncbi:hypothetical protein ACWCQN_38960 [Streptomyces sp. NPDC001984]|uniref:hypothetical protein n=1 Tax=Streptomyces sp. NPDC002619 TaxID=3364655 RepID=UPI0036B74575